MLWRKQTVEITPDEPRPDELEGVRGVLQQIIERAYRTSEPAIDVDMGIVDDVLEQARQVGIKSVLRELQDTDVSPWVLERAVEAARKGK